MISASKGHNCANHLIPEPIANPEVTQVLLSELGIETKALLAYLPFLNLYLIKMKVIIY